MFTWVQYLTLKRIYSVFFFCFLEVLAQSKLATLAHFSDSFRRNFPGLIVQTYNQTFFFHFRPWIQFTSTLFLWICIVCSDAKFVLALVIAKGPGAAEQLHLRHRWLKKSSVAMLFIVMAGPEAFSVSVYKCVIPSSMFTLFSGKDLRQYLLAYAINFHPSSIHPSIPYVAQQNACFFFLN